MDVSRATATQLARKTLLATMLQESVSAVPALKMKKQTNVIRAKLISSTSLKLVVGKSSVNI